MKTSSTRSDFRLPKTLNFNLSHRLLMTPDIQNKKNIHNTNLNPQNYSKMTFTSRNRNLSERPRTEQTNTKLNSIYNKARLLYIILIIYSMKQ